MNRNFTPAFLLGFFLLLVVIVINHTTAGRMRAYTNHVKASRELILAFTDLSNDLKSAEIYTPTYARTEAPAFYRLYRQDLDSLPADLERLRYIVEHDSVHRARVERVGTMVNEQLETLAQKNIAEMIQSGESWRLNFLFAIHRELEEGIERENSALAQHKTELDRIIRVTGVLTVGLSLLAIVITLFVFVRNTRLREERQRYEDELKKKLDELEISNKELEQYAYVASHDLQEPLRKIQLYCGFLERSQRERLDEKGRLHLERIMWSSERMSALITDIINFSSAKKDAEFARIELDAVLETVLDDLGHVIEQKAARIEKSALPPVQGISLQLIQLFYNLLNNSLKFSKDGVPPVISISARPLDPAAAGAMPGLEKNRTYCEITVRDNGIGFSPDYADQIFGLFKRLNDRQVFAGSGIGLTLCRKVVQNHGGAIRAEGREGEGAVFYVVLPVEP